MKRVGHYGDQYITDSKIRCRARFTFFINKLSIKFRSP